jgi:hypothetical protein
VHLRHSDLMEMFCPLLPSSQHDGHEQFSSSHACRTQLMLPWSRLNG